MKHFTFIGIILSTIGLGSCHKTCENEVNQSVSNYLIFGHFYGECGGEGCIEIFKLETNRLLEDTNDNYPGRLDFYQANFHALSQQKFELAKDLISYFPPELLLDPAQVIGQPDAGDWGGLYIEYNYDGIRKFLLLDQMISNVPLAYHNFIYKVNQKIQLIQ